MATGDTYKVIENLVTNDACHFKALLAGDRVDNHVAMDADEMFRVENAVLILNEAGLLAEFSKQASIKPRYSSAWRPCAPVEWCDVDAACFWWGVEMRDAMRGGGEGERNPQST
jgi:hypothetical protein